jgi:hypothetical protein
VVHFGARILRHVAAKINAQAQRRPIRKIDPGKARTVSAPICPAPQSCAIISQ